MSKKAYFFTFFCLITFFYQEVLASHLLGGNIGYEYITTLPNGDKRYKIYLYIYRNCNSQTQFDRPINLGIYRNDGAKTLFTVIQIHPRTRRVQPPNANPNCPFNPNTCLEEGYYEQFVNLPDDTRGYRLSYIRCCRNAAVINLTQNTGQTYDAFIPNTQLNNSSPEFTSIPLPYLCVGDKVRIFNNATDADGDSLVYKFVRPYAGAGPTNPIPYPPNNWRWPANAIYNNGYSFSRPFGNFGTATINSASGVTEYIVNQPGNYVVAVEVEEYRNGVLISTSRRDLQILVIVCPPNPAPILDTVSNQTNTRYSIFEGDSISFQIKIKDTDSMVVAPDGDIFKINTNIPLKHPKLTNLQGKDSLLIQFTWQTSCEHDEFSPYKFSIVAQDFGCPDKVSYFDYVIEVKSTTLADLVSGPIRFCPNDTATYFVNGPNTSTYTWIIDNGTQIAGGNGNQIDIKWSSLPGNGGKIRCIETSSNGCIGDTLELKTTVLSIPLANAGVNQTICSGDTIFLGSNNDPKLAYNWSPNQHLSFDTIANPAFSFLNYSNKDTIIRYIVDVDYNFIDCIDYTRSDTIDITIHPLPKTSEIQGDTGICINTERISYTIEPTPKSTYLWQVSGGTILNGNGGDSIAIDWGSVPGNYEIIVTETDSNNCVGLPQILEIELYDIPQPGNILGENVICLSDLRGFSYHLANRPSSSIFDWKAGNGNIVSGFGNDSIIVNWFNTSPLSLSVIETNEHGCISEKKELEIIIDNPSNELLSVSTLENNPKILQVKWNPKDMDLFTGPYEIYYRESRFWSWNFAGTAPANVRSLDIDFLDLNNLQYDFIVRGKNQCEDIFQTKIHRNILLKGDLDSTLEEATIYWTPYINWEFGVNNYELYSKVNEAENNSLDFQTATDTNFYKTISFDDYKHCFRVKAQEKSGNFETSWSNEYCVYLEPFLQIPNAFSPRKSIGINDYFRIVGGRVKTFNIEIYK